jgi:hypothetical protein
MRDGIHPRRPTRSRRTFLVAAALLSVVLVAGCGGSSSSLTSSASSAASGSATTAGSSTAAGAGIGSSGSTASASSGSGPLAYSRCMRTNGVPNFPDPNPGGGFDLGAGIDPSSPAFKAAQAKCQKNLQGGGLPGPGTTTHPSPQTLAKLVKIAQCMRQHGVPQFPDPVTSVPSNPLGSGIREVTDFDGAILLFPSTINMQSPAYKQALTRCGAPPLGLPH